MQGYRQRLISMQDQYIFHDWNFILTNTNTNVLVLTKPNPVRKSSKFDIQKVEVEILWPTQIFRLIYSDKPICISKYAYIGEIGLNNTKNIFIFKNESLLCISSIFFIEIHVSFGKMSLYKYFDWYLQLQIVSIFNSALEHCGH